MRSRGLLFALAPLALGSCKGCDDAPKRADAGDDASPAPVVVEEAGGGDAGLAVDAGAALAPLPAEDAGPSACKLTYGPAEQSFRGPAAMSTTAGELRLVANDGGRPLMFKVALDAKTPPRPSSFVGTRWPPCELAGKFVYCQGPGGPITRTTLGTSDTKTVVSRSRAGARIVAAALGTGEHSVVAFLDTRQTTEGAMIQAFVALDENEPMRLSDDGAGATTMRMASRGGAGEGPSRAVFVYLDTRTAMVPVHARTVTLKDGALVLGEDAVAFVGGAPERGVDLALAGGGSKLFALVPMPRETLEFGMVAIPISDPPKDDVAATWSLYPNGLDPAPIGASLDGWVARVRPREAMPGALRVLELGRLDEAGVFQSLGVISEGKKITDIAVTTDQRGGVWILYGDAGATWLERRVCP